MPSRLHVFNNNVDLTIFNQEEVYSKAQAEMVLKDFFQQNAPKVLLSSIRVSKEGNAMQLEHSQQHKVRIIRTYFFVKESGGTASIQELR